MNTKNKGILFLLFTGIYVFYFFISTGLNTSNDGAHIGLAKALYYDQDLSVEKYLDVYVKRPDYAVKDGVIYSDRLPGTALLMIPYFGYANVLESVGVKTTDPSHELDIVVASMMPPLFGVLSAMLLFWYYYIMLRKSFKLSVISTFIFSFGTLTLLESSHLFSHAPSMFFVSFAILLAVSKLTMSTAKKLLIISVLLGFATLIELQNFLFIFPVLLFVFFKERYFENKQLVQFVKISTLPIIIIFLFLTFLSYYNYLAFDDFTLKSNKYNPFFPEESSFISALSGDFLVGLDRLFTSFTNLNAYIDPRVARLNEIPGVFVTSPVMILSAIGFFTFYKEYKKECLLFLVCISISVLIAALHVTTLVRHIHTITLLMFLPFIFSLEHILFRMQNTKRIFAYSVLIILTLISFLRVGYSTISYWGRNLDNLFLYSKEWLVFLVANLPLALIGFLWYQWNKRRKVVY